MYCVFFFNDTATTEIYTLSLHDALPISSVDMGHRRSTASRRLQIWPTVCRRRAAVCRYGPPSVDGEDRKSTRLNSSHSSISYAVFCLKKKRKESTPPQCPRPGLATH